MATNGSQTDPRHPFADSFPFPDMVDDDIHSSGYVSFEHIVGSLIWGCSQAELHLFDLSNTVEAVTLNRHFSASCVPAEWPVNPPIMAQFSFDWPVEYSTLSLLGDEAICDLYHAPGTRCRHQGLVAAPIVDIELVYALSEEIVQHLDSDEGIERTARRIRRMFTDLVEHENIVAVEAVAVFGEAGLRLASLRAGHIWVLEDELSDLTLLRESIMAICHEMGTVLRYLHGEFLAAREGS